MDTFDKLRKVSPYLWLTFAAVFSTIMDAGSDRVMLIMFSADMSDWSLWSIFDWTPIQWLWHILKWGSFYTWPVIVLYRETFIYKLITPMFDIILALACYVLWELIYRADFWELIK